MMPAIVARRPKRPTARRLFAFDRDLGVRFVAGADEAGRGCLAGPLVAAAVLFDYERLGLREVRALSALNDSKQHTAEAREALFPIVMRSATRVAVVSRCVRGIDGRGLHVTNLAALRDALLRVARPGLRVPVRRLPRRRRRPRPARGHQRRRPQRGDRRRLDRRQGHPRPLHAARRRRCTPAGSSPPTSATRRPSTARRSWRAASRRCTGCRSSRRPISSWRCSFRRLRAPGRPHGARSVGTPGSIARLHLRPIVGPNCSRAFHRQRRVSLPADGAPMRRSGSRRARTPPPGAPARPAGRVRRSSPRSRRSEARRRAGGRCVLASHCRAIARTRLRLAPPSASHGRPLPARRVLTSQKTRRTPSKATRSSSPARVR